MTETKEPPKISVKGRYHCPECKIHCDFTTAVRDGKYYMIGDSDWVAQESPIKCPQCGGQLEATFSNYP